MFVEAVGGPGAWEGKAEHSAQMHRDNAYTLIGQVNEGRRPYSRADAEAIRAPTLLIGGADTSPPFPTILDALERSIGDVARAAIPGATHLMSEQEPEAFSRAVLDFLRERG